MSYEVRAEILVDVLADNEEHAKAMVQQRLNDADIGNYEIVYLVAESREDGGEK